MDTDPAGVTASTQRRIEYEQDLVENAIGMVAAGGSRRVTVAGIRFGEELLPEATKLAGVMGVVVRPVWGLGDAGCDIVVEASE
jgi:hypothetical protein